MTRDETCFETRLTRAIANTLVGPVTDCPRATCRRHRQCNYSYDPYSGYRSDCLSGYDDEGEAMIVSIWQTCSDMLNGTFPQGPAEDPAKHTAEVASMVACSQLLAPGSPEEKQFLDFLVRYYTPPQTEEQKLIARYRADIEADIAKIRSLNPAR